VTTSTTATAPPCPRCGKNIWGREEGAGWGRPSASGGSVGKKGWDGDGLALHSPRG
jgi:hypothetical protein